MPHRSDDAPGGSSPSARAGPDARGEAQRGPDGAAGRERRALAHGTGVLFQSAGLVLALGGCCIGSLVGLAQRPDRDALQQPGAWTVVGAWRAFDPHARLGTVSIFATCAGGLGVLAAGIGLQNDRYGSARLAAVVTVPLALFHLGYVAYLFVAGPLRWWIVVPLLLAGVWLGLAVLALACVALHRRFPPPRGPEPLPPGTPLPGTMGDRALRELRGGPDAP